MQMVNPPAIGLRIFSSTYIPLCVYIHAKKLLKYVGCRPVSGSRWKYQHLFEDPEGVSQQIRLDFDSGAQVPAQAFYASLQFLREEMNKEKIKGDNNGPQAARQI